ncbi:unnamed protein product [Clonostachys solani]|uniref:Uncharacterized protein n=1 Tax=Clonostachys solani TaxID=160281 RepID=A0A9N9YYR6_9HYPO|nr:unnamed protein product [Clonostachys solani]
MALPPEIVSHIVSQLLEPVCMPYWSKELDGDNGWEGFKQCAPSRIVSFEKKGPYWLSGYSEYEMTFYNVDINLRTLLNLRLVSHEWNMASTAILRKHHWWRASLEDEDRSLEMAINATCAAKTRRLVGRGADQETGQPNYYDRLFDQQDAAFPLAPENNELTPPYSALRNLFDNIEGIEALQLSYPTALGLPIQSQLLTDPKAEVDCIDLQIMKNITATLQYGFLSPALSSLTDLSLHLPCTHNVGEVVSCLHQTARDRLKHFDIGITDQTGQFGDKFTVRDEEDEDAIPHDHNEFLQSPLQDLYPNTEHQGPLWEFIAACPNLESLAVNATHFLDLDYLTERNIPISKRLKVLWLHRVYASVPSLKALMGRNGEKLPIQRVRLDEVKIHVDGGFWYDLFSFLMEDGHNLEFASFDQLTYFRGHPSYYPLSRSWKNNDDLWSMSRRDREYIHKLLLKVTSKYTFP